MECSRSLVPRRGSDGRRTVLDRCRCVRRRARARSDGRADAEQVAGGAVAHGTGADRLGVLGQVTRARKLLWLNIAFLVLSIAVWIAAIVLGWLRSVAFVSHISMLALVVSAI